MYFWPISNVSPCMMNKSTNTQARQDRVTSAGSTICKGNVSRLFDNKNLPMANRMSKTLFGHIASASAIPSYLKKVPASKLSDCSCWT